MSPLDAAADRDGRPPLGEDLRRAGVLVDVKTEAVAFYGKLGFAPPVAVTGTLDERPRPTPMFLPVAGIPD